MSLNLPICKIKYCRLTHTHTRTCMQHSHTGSTTHTHTHRQIQGTQMDVTKAKMPTEQSGINSIVKLSDGKVGKEIGFKKYFDIFEKL